MFIKQAREKEKKEFDDLEDIKKYQDEQLYLLSQQISEYNRKLMEKQTQTNLSR